MWGTLGPRQANASVCKAGHLDHEDKILIAIGGDKKPRYGPGQRRWAM